MSDDRTTMRTRSQRKVLEDLNIVYGDLTSAEVREDDETGEKELVIEVAEARGECPACGSVTIGAGAWNSAHDCDFGCRNNSCAVEKHSNAVFRPLGGTHKDGDDLD
jgi:hypothetical protein